MLDETRPSDRLDNLSSPDDFIGELNRLYHAIVELQRAQAPSAGDGSFDEWRKAEYGRVSNEIQLKDRESALAEIGRALGVSDGRDLDRTLAAIAQLQRELSEKEREWLHRGETCERLQRHLEDERDTVGHLQRELGERTSQLEGMHGERDSERAIATEWESKCEDLRAALESANATGEELLRQRDEAREQRDSALQSWNEDTIKRKADRDRLQAELDAVGVALTKAFPEVADCSDTESAIRSARNLLDDATAELASVREELNEQVKLWRKNVYRNQDTEGADLHDDGFRHATLLCAQDIGDILRGQKAHSYHGSRPVPETEVVSVAELASLRAQSSDGLREAVEKQAASWQKLGNEVWAFAADKLWGILAAHTAPAEVSGEACEKCKSYGHTAPCLACATPTPAPVASAEMLAERVSDKLQGLADENESGGLHTRANCYRSALRIVTEELASLRGGE